MAYPDHKCATEIIDYIGDRILFLSVSGGKDSTAMALHLKDMGIPYKAIFIDTGWEHPSTIEYVKEYLPAHVGPIEIIQSKGFKKMLRDRAKFPNHFQRFCTGDLKLNPVASFYRRQDSDVVNAVGIRAEESRNRSKMPMWEDNSHMDCEVWRPIIHFTEQDVINIHHKHGVTPNPLYLIGLPRVGCWPCIFSTKRAIRIMARETPERIDEIRKLEREINLRRRARKPGSPLISFFNKGKGAMLIDDVVTWATESQDDIELFTNSDTESGCVKWGLCDIAHKHNAERKKGRLK